ncbi:MAG: class I SAM-dependent methyltransferase [Promethearchaeota archaeon]
MNSSKDGHCWNSHDYDQKILTLIPHYNEILDSIISLIPFSSQDSLKIIDLGCGTGTLAFGLIQRYPRAKITCLDMDAEMIDITRQKLQDFSGVSYEVASFSDYEFKDKYDVIVSSLALHHLTGDSAKRDFYTRIIQALVPGGVFYNGDVVKSAGEFLENCYLDKWIEFLRLRYPENEIREVYLQKMYHPEIPTPLLIQLQWLHEIGFVSVDVVWKFFHYAVFGGTKPE